MTPLAIGTAPVHLRSTSPTPYCDALMRGLTPLDESIVTPDTASIVPVAASIVPPGAAPIVASTAASTRSRDPGVIASPRTGATPAQPPKRPLSPASLFAPPRSVMAKTLSKPNPSTRRGPTDTELVKERAANPAYSVPTAWLHFQGAGPTSICSIAAHCLSVENLPAETRPGAAAHPIFSFVLGRAGRVGVVFRTIAHLERQIAHPPFMGGALCPWRTPEGVFAPFWLTRAPATKEGATLLAPSASLAASITSSGRK
ncbi:hypothetical protein FB639_001706 [Coemansia asiatica]|nr:hypothetical protein FB639_001706 [Coemansia asiatica]